ncbi:MULTISPECIES: ABC transporter substrate-binding protein [unclassified Bradyrhizobium]|uniref:ABC transporter substrate-binding protein n=1 Tax=unclassified Bradyrhizobium TaxID=2631580 RepID=UPI001FF9D0FD|nr:MULTISPECIES: ABC transporter substrate-binding protein [unclassified Bradyrhizobium]MCK1297378.1 ABC transporter substrate-binding protein [Bradyrhizobium sp. 37]MCK1769084.1 ABC transporter substrate-binding protein [Bradyrhizobium sp. 134]
MTMKRSILWTSLAFTALVAATPALSADKVAKIGVLAPLTGSTAADGKEMVDGAKLAVDEINAGGGVAGYKLQAVVGDTQAGSADQVTSAIERLTGDRDLNAIVTGFTSSSNFEINIMAEQDMPYLLYGSANQTRDIIAPHPDKFPTVYSLSPSFDAYETEMIPVLHGLEKSGKLKLLNKKVALLSSDIPYSKSIMNGLIKSFKEVGWTVTSADLVPWGQIDDWRTFLAKIRQDNPAVVINTDPQPGNAARFITQFLEQPTDSIVFIQYAPHIPEFLELTGKKSTGVIYNLIGGTIPGARTAEIVKKIKDKYGYEPGSTAPAVYEEVMLYADALKKVGDPTKRLEIGKAIGETRKSIAEGMLSFDPKTHLAVQGNDALPILFFQIRDGKRVLFSPANLADGEFRAPPWMKQ